MTSAANLIISVSILSMATAFAACDSGGDNGGAAGSGPISVAGSGNGTAGAPPSGGGASGAPAGTAGSGGGLVLPEGVPLTPADGWVPVDNAAKIQGAVFAFGDPTSKMGMEENFMGSNACIKGTAAKVDMTSMACTTKMFTPPAMDCYGEYWGAAIGMNLNQTIDMTLVPPMGGTPMAYDASAIKGFAFVVSGNTVPAPGAFRFKVEDGTSEFCNPSAIKIKVGVNTVNFSDLVSQCWTTTDPPAATAETVKSKLIKISWQVVTNANSTVPFDFCISDVRAILTAGGTGGGGAGAGGSGAGGAGTAGAGTAGAGTAGAGTAGAGTAGAGTAGAGTAGAGGASAGTGSATAGSSGAN